MEAILGPYANSDEGFQKKLKAEKENIQTSQKKPFPLGDGGGFSPYSVFSDNSNFLENFTKQSLKMQ